MAQLDPSVPLPDWYAMNRDAPCNEDLLRRLPLPLAQLYRRVHNASTPLDRHQAAYFLWEAALKLLGCVALCSYAECDPADPELTERLRNLSRPSVGHWWEFARLLVPVLADGGDAGFQGLRDQLLNRSPDDLPQAAELDAILRQELEGRSATADKVRLSELFERLVRYRNREVGHGVPGQRPGKFYERMGRALLAGVPEVLARLDVLAGRGLVHVSDVRRLPSGSWRVERYALIGETARRLEPLELRAAEAASLPSPQCVYLETSGRLLSAHPLLLYDEEAARMLLFNSRRGRNRAEYLDYTGGGVVERPELEGELGPLWSQLLGTTAGDEPSAATPQPEPTAKPIAAPTVKLVSPQPLPPGGVWVVLLYKRNAQPDEELLRWLEKEFAARGFQVFVDRHMTIGVQWAQELERRVRAADAVVLLLSAASISSEMLAYEVQVAHDEAQKRGGKPLLLPVRLNYEGALPSELAGVLDRLQYFLWKGHGDDERLLAELLNALQRPPSLKKVPPPVGVVPLDAKYYIVRPTDREFEEAIARRDSVILIRGARQMGKTSLLARGLSQARSAGARVVLTDFQKLNAADLVSVEKLFRTLAEWIADELDLEPPGDAAWEARRGPSVNFERFLRRRVLDKLGAPLVWAMDEVDRLFTCDFGSEVFGLFRSWHNARVLDPASSWGQLTLAIAYATEAHLFITDMNQSPFNIGTRVTLEDFTPEQVADLNRRYGAPLRNDAELQRFYRLVSGQPYLANRGLYEMVQRGLDIAGFEAQAGRDDGVFGDHLRRLLILLARDAELCDVVRGVLRGRPCPSPEVFYRLRSPGVLAGESAAEARPRCQLYADYLKRHLL